MLTAFGIVLMLIVLVGVVTTLDSLISLLIDED